MPLPRFRSSSSNAFNKLPSPLTVTEEQKPRFKSALLPSPTALTVAFERKPISGLHYRPQAELKV